MTDTMPLWLLWVDWDAGVISFHREDDFEEVSFPSREQMLAFATEKSESGFSIQ